MSQSPVEQDESPDDGYLEAFSELSERIRRGLSFSGEERNRAFLNRGDGHFADLSFALGLDATDDGRGIALTDIDGDGDPDLCLTNRTAPRLRLMRNDLLGSGRSVSLRLEGDPGLGCSRDAIGARVELEVSGRVLHRSLAAGDGFASQSSKALHFGLGTDGEIGEVRVRWPGGEIEVFRSVGTSGRFLLKQGAGEARPALLSPAAPLKVGAPPVPIASEIARVRLSQPLQLPTSLRFETLAGEDVVLGDFTKKGKVLVSLWASWCAPCLVELKALADREAELKAAGVTIVALSVDGLEGTAVEGSRLIEALRSTGFKGKSGLANEAFVGEFDRLFTEAVYRHRGMPLPSGFLIDRGGWLSVIYKGGASPEQIIADAATLGLGPAVARSESLPFEGRWAESEFPSNPIEVASSYQEGGYLDDAHDYLESYLNEHRVAPGSPLPLKRAMLLADVHFFLGELLSSQGRSNDALSHFKAAAHFSPNNANYTARKVLALAQAGDAREALREAKAMRESSPGEPEALALYGEVALALKDEIAAAEAFAAILDIDPDHIAAIHQLARLRATASAESVRDAAEAVSLAERLLNVSGEGENPLFLVTMAKAYAAAGREDEALAALQKGKALALRESDRALVDEVSEAETEIGQILRR